MHDAVIVLSWRLLRRLVTRSGVGPVFVASMRVPTIFDQRRCYNTSVLVQHNFLRSLRVQLLTFSDTNSLDFSGSASPAAPLAAEAACTMAPDFGVLGTGY